VTQAGEDVPERAVPHVAEYPDDPGVTHWGSVRQVASEDGGRLGLIVYPRWTIECDRGCELGLKATLVKAVRALRDHWQEVHGWSE
jgi:hypothetical protein